MTTKEFMQPEPHKTVCIPAKLYALMRMRMAIDRAIACPTLEEKEKAARWAAAWGEIAGIPKGRKGAKAANDAKDSYGFDVEQCTVRDI